MIDKKQFLIEFIETDYYKCAFNLTDGTRYQGWITEVNDTTFMYFDSGPMARDEPYTLSIDIIDETSFAYWNELQKTWMTYPGQVAVTPTPIRYSFFEKIMKRIGF